MTLTSQRGIIQDEHALRKGLAFLPTTTHTIQNEQVTVSVESLGAQLKSIELQGVPYLWDGHAPYWSGRAPLLFPTVGALRDGRAESAKGEITLPRHGFAKLMEWTLESKTEQAVTFLLTSTEETLRQYPYPFEARVCYSIDQNRVTTTFTVKNTGDAVMPYLFGGHPGFHIPLVEGESFEDYMVEFEYPETVDCPQVSSQGLIIGKVRNRFLTNQNSFRLNHVLYRGDALIFDSLRSKSVKVYSEKSGRGVEMDFTGFPFFALWSPATDSPFVCLEPWMGTGTQEHEDDVFEHKQGMLMLPPGEQNTHAFTVTLLG